MFSITIRKSGYSLLSPLNEVYAKYSNNTPILDTHQFVWTANFRNNWQSIRDEFLEYARDNIVPFHKDVNSDVSTCDTYDGWKTLYLRVFNRDTDVMKYFPLTSELINSAPACTLAHCSVLSPGTVLEPHTGVYGGVLRYHLGLIVPKNPSDCFLYIDGTRLHWEEGKDIMFDDMYEHYAENNSNEYRVVLFLDIKKELKNPIINILNSAVLYFASTNDVVDMTVSNVNSMTI